MTPTPVPLDVDQVAPLAYLAAAGIVVGVGFVFVWAILRAAHYEAPASLVVALSLLTFLALVGAIVVDSSELVTLAATGFGALAGAVSSAFPPRRRGDQLDDET